jgi:hypothetical protein
MNPPSPTFWVYVPKGAWPWIAVAVVIVLVVFAYVFWKNQY